ncbi:MAG: mechanosensitive ion channel family protein [bacterium]|nr:mechanosensitive ion channel family protein [bacterium]
MFGSIDEEALLEVVRSTGIIVAILIITFLLAKSVKRVMLRKENFIRVDTTQYKFLTHFFSGMIYFAGFLLAVYSIPSGRVLAASMFAGSSIVAIIIGFASRHAFANIVGGIFVAIFKPFRIGDRIRLVENDFIGIVEDITLRHTVLRTFENKRIVIPNSVISSEILENSNIIDERTLKFFNVHISYSADIDHAMSIIKEIACSHPEFLDTRTDEEKKEGTEAVNVRVIELGDFAVHLRAWVWAANPGSAFNLGCDMNKQVKERFDKEGIEIPFPYRNVVMK